jgi:uncharacterized protein
MEALLILLATFFLGCLGVGVYAGFRLLHPHRVPVFETFQSQYENGEIPQAFLTEKREIFKVVSDFGYEISGIYFTGTSNKTVIFCHGISWTKYGVAKYLGPFFKDGWNILLYDHRSAGESGGKYPSFGFYEKMDLKAVVDFARRKFPNTEKLGLFGESLGGAIVLQYSPMDKNIDFLVTICPFTSLAGLVKSHLRKFFIPSFLDPIILFFADLYVWFWGSFSIYDVEPEKDGLFSKTPLFLMHGMKDTLVPYYMGENLYKRRKEIAPTYFLSIPESGHTPFLYTENKKLFESELSNFIENYIHL